MSSTAGPRIEKYDRLGNSGLKIAPVLVGCMSYGTPDWQEWVLNEEESLPLLKYAYDIGLQTWDTADIYSHGVSEQIVGKAIKKYNIPRHRLTILTKCYFGVSDDGSLPGYHESVINDGPWVNRQGLSRKHIFDAVDASVERLGTYIDILHIHRFSQDVPAEEIMRALNDVVNSGKVRYLGGSSMAAWEFQTLQNIADKNGWHKFISMQGYYNLLYREEEREMNPYCKANGIGLIPWSPIARGALARPFDSRSSLRENTDKRVKSLIRIHDDSNKVIIDRVEEVAKRHGVSMAMIAIAWCLLKGTNPIVGCSKKERLDEAVQSIAFARSGKLTKEDIEYLESSYAPQDVSGF